MASVGVKIRIVGYLFSYGKLVGLTIQPMI